MTSENNGMYMPVAPAFGYSGGNGGFGNFGGDGWWILLLLLLAGNGMWGGFGGGNMMWPMMMGGMGGFGGMYEFPWLLASNANNQNATNANFSSLELGDQISGLRSDVTGGFADTALGIAGVNQNICQTGSGIVSAITGAQNAVSAQMYNNEIANLNRSFAEQTANAQGFNGLQGQLAQCCCDNRLATANLQSVIQAENCADRESINNGIRDLLTATTAQNQRILDKLCDQELQAERRENQNLRTRLNMADLAASQAAQTAQLIADNTQQTQYIVNRVAPYPIPAYPVGNPYGYYNGGYGWNNGCGCNGSYGFAN